MAFATGSQIRPELSAVDYTPFLKASGQAAQMQAQGIGAAVGGAMKGFDTFVQQKKENQQLEADVKGVSKLGQSLVPLLNSINPAASDTVSKILLEVNNPNTPLRERSRLAKMVNGEVANILNFAEMGRATEERKQNKHIQDFVNASLVYTDPGFPPGMTEESISRAKILSEIKRLEPEFVKRQDTRAFAAALENNHETAELFLRDYSRNGGTPTPELLKGLREIYGGDPVVKNIQGVGKGVWLNGTFTIFPTQAPKPISESARKAEEEQIYKNEFVQASINSGGDFNKFPDSFKKKVAARTVDEKPDVFGNRESPQEKVTRIFQSFQQDLTEKLPTTGGKPKLPEGFAPSAPVKVPEKPDAATPAPRAATASLAGSPPNVTVSLSPNQAPNSGVYPNEAWAAYARDLQGQAPASDLQGQAPASDLQGQAPASDLQGQAPASDLQGQEPASELATQEAYTPSSFSTPQVGPAAEVAGEPTQPVSIPKEAVKSAAAPKEPIGKRVSTPGEIRDQAAAEVLVSEGIDPSVIDIKNKVFVGGNLLLPPQIKGEWPTKSKLEGRIYSIKQDINENVVKLHEIKDKRIGASGKLDALAIRKVATNIAKGREKLAEEQAMLQNLYPEKKDDSKQPTDIELLEMRLNRIEQIEKGSSEEPSRLPELTGSAKRYMRELFEQYEDREKRSSGTRTPDRLEPAEKSSGKSGVDNERTVTINAERLKAIISNPQIPVESLEGLLEVDRKETRKLTDESFRRAQILRELERAFPARTVRRAK